MCNGTVSNFYSMKPSLFKSYDVQNTLSLSSGSLNSGKYYIMKRLHVCCASSGTPTSLLDDRAEVSRGENPSIPGVGGAGHLLGPSTWCPSEAQ